VRETKERKLEGNFGESEVTSQLHKESGQSPHKAVTVAGGRLARSARPEVGNQAGCKSGKIQAKRICEGQQVLTLKPMNTGGICIVLLSILVT
jgi:hypothetical protein